ncbi:MAG TPA: hypothetical protein VGB00_20250 [Pyrinomonadaceae bacterium]|jgi:hypothetical protein
MNTLHQFLTIEIWTLLIGLVVLIFVSLILKIDFFLRVLVLHTATAGSQVLNIQTILITLFCAIYLIVMISEQNTDFPEIPSWMLVLLGISYSAKGGEKLYDLFQQK